MLHHLLQNHNYTEYYDYTAAKSKIMRASTSHTLHRHRVKHMLVKDFLLYSHASLLVSFLSKKFFQKKWTNNEKTLRNSSAHIGKHKENAKGK